MLDTLLYLLECLTHLLSITHDKTVKVLNAVMSVACLIQSMASIALHVRFRTFSLYMFPQKRSSYSYLFASCAFHRLHRTCCKMISQCSVLHSSPTVVRAFDRSELALLCDMLDQVVVFDILTVAVSVDATEGSPFIKLLHYWVNFFDSFKGGFAVLTLTTTISSGDAFTA